MPSALRTTTFGTGASSFEHWPSRLLSMQATPYPVTLADAVSVTVGDIAGVDVDVDAGFDVGVTVTVGDTVDVDVTATVSASADIDAGAAATGVDARPHKAPAKTTRAAQTGLIIAVAFPIIPTMRTSSALSIRPNPRLRIPSPG
jgi:hypothetical protein